MVSAFLGFAPALASGKHINVDLLITKLPPKTNKALSAFVSLLGLDGAKARAAELVAQAESALSPYGAGAANLIAAARFAISRES